MSFMFEATIIEFTLASLLQYLGKQLFKTPKDKAPVDFIYKDDDGKIVAIEVKSTKINTSSLMRVLEDFKTGKDRIDKFYLITPDVPPKDIQENITKLARNMAGSGFGFFDLISTIFAPW